MQTFSRRRSGPGARSSGRATWAGSASHAAVSHLQHAAGNEAVAGMLRGSVGSYGSAAVRSLTVQRAPGPLTPAEEKAAITFNRGLYDANSVRFIQVVVGSGVDGKFGPISAQAVANFQIANGIVRTGNVDQPTLDAVVAASVTQGEQDQGIYVASDFFGIPIRADALSIRFDAGLATASANAFETGNLRVIRIGPTAMTSAANVRNAVNAALAVPAPAVAVPGATPTLLTPVQEKSALAFNRSKFRDPRSIRVVQGLVGTTPVPSSPVTPSSAWPSFRPPPASPSTGRSAARRCGRWSRNWMPVATRTAPSA